MLLKERNMLLTTLYAYEEENISMPNEERIDKVSGDTFFTHTRVDCQIEANVRLLHARGFGKSYFTDHIRRELRGPAPCAD